MATTRDRHYVEIVIDSAKASRQLRNIDRNMGLVRRSAQGIEKAFRRLNSVFALAIGGTVITNAVRDLAALSGQMQELQGRVGLVAADTVGTAQAMSDLTDVAMRTFTSLQATAGAYARLGIVTKEVGVSHDELITVIQGLNDSLRISGASAKEAQATMLQFAQALGAGALQGDEFRSFAEASPRGLKVLADALGVTTGALKEMSKQGELTRDVLIDAFITQAPTLRAEAEKLPITIGRAWENVRTAFAVLVADFEAGVGIFGDIAEAFSLIASKLVEWNRAKEATRQADLERVFFATQAQVRQLSGAITVLNMEYDESLKIIKETNKEYRTSLEIDKERTRLLEELAEAQKKLQETYRQLPAGGGIRAPNAPISRPTPAAPGPTDKEIAAANRELERQAEIMQRQVAVMENAIWESWIEGQERIAESIKLSIDPLEEYVQGFQELEQAALSSVEPTHDLLKEIELLEKAIKVTGDETGALAEKIFILQGRIDEELVGTVEEIKDSMDELSVAIGQTMANAVDRLGDTIVDFATGAETSFSDMANSILQDIARMMVKFALMQILFGGKVGSGGGLLGGLFTPSAKGNAFAGGNVIPFAKGGVVSRPTIFPMANGAGVMAERGPEAVMPLSRDRRGRLGVTGSATVVNITNNTGAPVEQQISNGPNGEEIVNVVVGRVASEIMTGGPTARAIEQSYGVRRAGFHR